MPIFSDFHSKPYVSVIKQPFLFVGSRCRDNPFNLKSFKHVYWFPDTMHYRNQLYELDIHEGYCLKGNYLYVPLVAVDTVQHSIKFTNTQIIGEFRLQNNQRAIIEKYYTFNFPKKTIDFFVRLDAHGQPIVVDKRSRCLVFPESNHYLYYNQMGGGKPISYIYDLNFTQNNKIRFLGVVNNRDKTVVKGVYDQRTGTAYTIPIAKHAAFDAVRIHGNKFKSYDKSNNGIVNFRTGKVFLKK